jgi:hypothetical protein
MQRPGGPRRSVSMATKGVSCRRPSAGLWAAPSSTHHRPIDGIDRQLDVHVSCSRWGSNSRSNHKHLPCRPTNKTGLCLYDCSHDCGMAAPTLWHCICSRDLGNPRLQPEGAVTSLSCPALSLSLPTRHDVVPQRREPLPGVHHASSYYCVVGYSSPRLIQGGQREMGRGGP